jgi:broad specificity phosphatase PhoE
MKQSIPIKPFYFIRHGESEWNVINKFAGGQTDTPLTNKGIEQAKAAAYVLNKIELKPDYIAHSTMVRAEKTAFTINQNSKIKMVPYQNLRELDGGDWTGGVFTELNKRWEAGEKPNNGESLDMFANRIHTIFSTILNQP